MAINETPTKGSIMPKTLRCKTHKNQPRYGCTLCDQAIKAWIEKTLPRYSQIQTR